MFPKSLILLALLVLSSAKSSYKEAKALKGASNEFHRGVQRVSNLTQVDGDDEETGISTNRGLLEAGSCEWDEYYYGCSISTDTQIKTLQKLNTPLADGFISELTCLGQKTISDCESVGYCGWYEGECALTDYGYFADSPCVDAAPDFFTFYKYVFICSNIYSADSCDAVENCVWDEDESTCDPDFSGIYLGVSEREFDKALAKMTRKDYSARRSTFEQNFDTNDAAFEWDAVLGWTVGIDCLKSIPSKVCPLFSEWVQGINSVQFYCAERYQLEHKECKKDENCDFDYFGQCKISEDAIEKQGNNYLLEFPKYVDKQGDRDILSAIFGCFLISDKDVCTKECYWTMLAMHGTNSEDSTCAFFDYLGRTECDGIADKKECNAKEFCYYDLYYGEPCGISSEKTLKEVFGERVDLYKDYRKTEKECKSYYFDDCQGEN